MKIVTSAHRFDESGLYCRKAQVVGRKRDGRDTSVAEGMSKPGYTAQTEA